MVRFTEKLQLLQPHRLAPRAVGYSLKIEPTVNYGWQPWNWGRCVSPPEHIRISERHKESDSPANPPGPHPGRYCHSDQHQSCAHHRCDDSPDKIEFPIICCWSIASTESAPDKPSRNPERESDQQRERHGPEQVEGRDAETRWFLCAYCHVSQNSPFPRWRTRPPGLKYPVWTFR